VTALAFGEKRVMVFSQGFGGFPNEWRNGSAHCALLARLEIEGKTTATDSK